MKRQRRERDTSPAVDDVVDRGPAEGKAEVLDELEKGDEQEEGADRTAGMAGKGGQDEEGEEIEAAGVKQDVGPVVSEKQPGRHPLKLERTAGGF